MDNVSPLFFQFFRVIFTSGNGELLSESTSFLSDRLFLFLLYDVCRGSKSLLVIKSVNSQNVIRRTLPAMTLRLVVDSSSLTEDLREVRSTSMITGYFNLLLNAVVVIVK